MINMSPYFVVWGQKGKSMAKSNQANNNRSNSMNPNNSAYKSSGDNRSNQYNPNNAAHKSGNDNRSNQMNPNHSKSKGR